MLVHAYLIEFDHFIAKLRKHNNKLPQTHTAYRSYHKKMKLVTTTGNELNHQVRSEKHERIF